MDRRALIAVVAAACHKPTPRVTIQPAAEPILDAWAEALGGRDRLAAVDGVHTHATIHRDGLDGTADGWWTARGELAMTDRLGPLVDTYVFDGTRGWLLDHNGEVRGEEDDERASDQLAAFLDSWSALLPGRVDGSVTAGADGSLILAVDADHAATVSFDPATHLPRTIATTTPDLTAVQTIERWRDAGGVKFIDASSTVRLGVTSTWRADTIELGHAPDGTFAEPPRRSDTTLAAAPIPLDVSALGHAYAKVRVNGSEPRWFLLDTGYSDSMVEKRTAEALGITRLGATVESGTGGVATGGYVADVTFDVGGTTLAHQSVTTDDLSSVNVVHELAGALGYDFFSRFVVELDFANREMRLHDPATYHHTRSGGTELAISLEGNVPRIPISIILADRTVDTHVIFDLGCACELSASYKLTEHEHLLAALPGAVSATSAGVGGNSAEVVATIPAIRIGALTIDHPRATFSRNPREATGFHLDGGLFGVKLASKYLVTLDYRDRKLWLDPR